MRTVREICKYIGGIIQECPNCVETGITFAITPENLINTTTNNILEYVAMPNSGDLYSIDIDEGRIEIARSIMPEEAVLRDSLCQYIFLCGDSVERLTEMNELMQQYEDRDFRVDLLCLDSSGDPNHILNEYNAIKESLSEKHFVLVDDIHNPSSVKYKKVVPLLKELNYDYIEVPTPTGMFMAAKGYELPKIGAI